MSEYSQQQINKLTIELRHMCKDLPPCVFEFIRGKESTTSVLTRIGYVRDLKIFFEFLVAEILYFKNLSIINITISQLDKVTPTDIEIFLEYLTLYTDKNGLQKSNSQSAKSRKLACLRSFYKYFIKKDKLKNNPASIVDMPKLKEKPIIRLDNNEVANLLDIVETGDRLSQKQRKIHDSRTKKRDLAIVILFLSTGIRISELVGINLDDLNFENNSFYVTRKGGKTDKLFFGKEARAALISYIDERQKITNVNSNDVNALFISMQKKRIGVRAVQKLVEKYTTSLNLKNISPHKLRSTFGTMLYNETGDIYLVADILGHKDANTTKKHYADQNEMRKYFASKQIILRENDED